MYTANIPIDRSVVTIPFELYVESDDGTQYIVKCNFVGSRQKNIGNLKTVSMAVSVVKAVWRKRIP